MVLPQDSNCPSKASNSAIHSTHRNEHAPKNAPIIGGCFNSVLNVDETPDFTLMQQSAVVACFQPSMFLQLSGLLSGLPWGWSHPGIHNPRVRDSKSLGCRFRSDSPRPGKARAQAALQAASWLALAAAGRRCCPSPVHPSLPVLSPTCPPVLESSPHALPIL